MPKLFLHKSKQILKTFPENGAIKTADQGVPAHVPAETLMSQWRTVLVRVSVTATKHNDQSYWVYSAHAFTSQKVRTGTWSRAGTWRQEQLIQKSWRGVVYWLAQQGLLCLLPCRTQDQKPRESIMCNCLGSPSTNHQLRKCLQACLQLHLTFSHLRFPPI